jgi:hypothetical protein
MDITHSKGLLLCCLLCGTLASVACAPVFSDFQSAKLAGRDRVEVTPSASTVSVSGSDGGHVQDEYGLQVGVGVLDRLDLRARYVRVGGFNGVGGINAVGFGPKIGLVKDRLALAVPVGFAFGQDLEIAAMNLGVGFGDLERWVIRPEIGLLFDPGESGRFTQFGLGLTVFAGKKKPAGP